MPFDVPDGQTVFLDSVILHFDSIPGLTVWKFR
jgi:hypothetical protein